MKIEIKKLKQINITPNQFIILNLIKNKKTSDLFWDIEKDLVSLQEKGLIKDEELTSKALTLFNKQNFTEWFNKWLALWPTQNMPGGYRVSGNSMQSRLRMAKFTNDFPNYDLDIIFKATQNYLKDRENNNWTFIKKNAKFIYDNEGSVLEQECQSIINNDNNVNTTNTIDL